jgi:hypothetical protein
MKSLLYIPCLTIIVLFSCVSNSQAQTIIRVFDKPEEFVGRTVTFRIWVDEAFMSAVKFYGPSSGAGFEGTERVLDGYLMVVGDGRNTPQQADKWGSPRGVLVGQEINVFVDKIIGTRLKELINGAAWATGTFTIKEVKVGVKLDGESKVIKVYVAHLQKITAVRDTSG